MLNCENKFDKFDKLIKEKKENYIKWVFNCDNFDLKDIDCYSYYIVRKFFKKITFDLRFSIELIIKESILNAVYHGNLNISSKIKNNDNGFEEFYALAEKKIKSPDYKYKNITLEVKKTINKLSIEVQDEGEGFNYKKIKFNNENTYGRGLKLIMLNCEKISWNDKGNKIIMEKVING